MNKKWIVFCTVVVACTMVYGEDGPKQIINEKGQPAEECDFRI